MVLALKKIAFLKNLFLMDVSYTNFPLIMPYNWTLPPGILRLSSGYPSQNAGPMTEDGAMNGGFTG